jgi:orotidine-5'-phosphate decarboxylase
MEPGNRGRRLVHFADRLGEAVRAKGNATLVGIDPRPENLPTALKQTLSGNPGEIGRAFTSFGTEVVDVVAPLVPAVKFQAAFYEAFGLEGIEALARSIQYARKKGLIVIFDGKRNDIGSTAEAYAKGYLETPEAGSSQSARWDADALTISPYLGGDGVKPFVDVAAKHQKGVFALVRTSNPSARDFQDLVAGGKPLYRHVAEKLRDWAEPQRGSSGYSLLGAVVGATYPAELAELREALPGILFLVPGYGSQGGKAADVAAAFDDDGMGAIVNNSRGVTFAYERPQYAEKYKGNWQACIEQAVHDMNADLAAHTNTGKLKAQTKSS